MRSAAVVLPSIGTCFLLACGSGDLSGNSSDASTDEDADTAPPPTLEVTAPARAAFAETDEVVVRGSAAAEDGVASVTVNGEPAELAADGSFSASLEISDTITLIETVATGEGGAETVDARALLAGALVDQDTPVPSAMSAHVGEAAMAGLGDMVSSYANGTNWTELARSQNPIAGSGSGCNQFRAFVTGVSVGGIDVTTRAATGGIRVGVQINNLRVNGHVDWRGACISGTTSFTITADRYTMGGLAAPGFVRGEIDVLLQNVGSQFQGFRLDASGVPSFVEDPFQSQARDYLAGMARDWVSREVPPIGRDFLSQFATNQFGLDVLGQRLEMDVRPTSMDWTENGGTLVLESTAAIAGVEGGVYLSNPRDRPRPGSLEGSHFEVAVADDAINQVLAAIWHSGALEQAILPDEAKALAVILQKDVDRVTATMQLPPVVSFDGEREVSRLTLGDVLLDVFGPEGEKLVTFAMSAEIEITAEPRENGGLRLTTGASRILAQVLESSPDVSVDGEALSSVADIVVPEIGRQASSLLEVIRVPGLPGGTIASPAVKPHEGYLAAGGQLDF